MSSQSHLASTQNRMRGEYMEHIIIKAAEEIAKKNNNSRKTSNVIHLELQNVISSDQALRHN